MKQKALFDCETYFLPFPPQVNWSPTPQLRTVVETELSAAQIFKFLKSTWKAEDVRDKEVKKSAAVKASFTGTKLFPFALATSDSLTNLLYRTFSFPWPLKDRDMFIVQDYTLYGDVLVTYNHTIDNSSYFGVRAGFVRCRFKPEARVVPSSEEHATLTETSFARSRRSRRSYRYSQEPGPRCDTSVEC